MTPDAQMGPAAAPDPSANELIPKATTTPTVHRASDTRPRPNYRSCPCGCSSRPREYFDPRCLRFVTDFGRLYRDKVDAQRAAEGRSVAA